ncbi:unnamed protein product, partial [Rotaria magnacalcarata]
LTHQFNQNNDDGQPAQVKRLVRSCPYKVSRIGIDEKMNCTYFEVDINIISIGQLCTQCSCFVCDHCSASSRSKKCSISLLSGTIIVLLLISLIGLSILHFTERNKTLDKHTKIAALVNDTSDLCLAPECITAASSLLESIDSTVDPCENFYMFSCGKWINNAKIPSDNAEQSSQSQMSTKLENVLVGMVDYSWYFI